MQGTRKSVLQRGGRIMHRDVLSARCADDTRSGRSSFDCGRNKQPRKPSARADRGHLVTPPQLFWFADRRASRRHN